MSPARLLWLAFRKSSEVIGTLFLWLLWLALSILLATQIYLVTSQQLAIPPWLLRQVEARLARSGLHAKFGGTILDPSGRVFMEDIRIFSETIEDPLFKIRTLYFQVDPWALLTGQIEPRQIRADGMDFFVPAMLSPSGKSEPVMKDLYLAAEPSSEEWLIEHLAGRLGNVALTARGTLRLAPPPGAPPRNPLSMDDLLRAYLHASRTLGALIGELNALDEPMVDLSFTSHLSRIAWVNASITARAAKIDPTRFGAPAGTGPLELSQLKLSLVAPLAGMAPVSTRVFFEVGAANLPGRGSLREGKLTLTGSLRADTYSFAPDNVEASFSSGTLEKMEIESPVVRVDLKNLPRLSGEIAGRAAGELWRAAGRADLQEKSATGRLAGRISPGLLTLIGDNVRVDLNELIRAPAPPALYATLNLTPGWKLQEAHGRVETGSVVARGVSVDEASADFSLRGTDLRVTDIVLFHGENVARGDYLMDTVSKEYQFLLLGRLRPLVISGWFQEWWKRFWGHFDFTVAPPDANVLVSGQWGRPESTLVFVYADCTRPVIQTVNFDRVRAMLFIRPDFYDALGFIANRDQREARGTFTRAVSLEKEGVRYMEFKVASNLDIRESARVFGNEGTEIVEPFRFAEPPSLRLAGHIDGPASEKGEHKEVEIEVKSTGAFSFYEFPLSDVSFGAHLHDSDIDLKDLAVAFAGGRLHGKARLSGKEEARRLSFDCALEDASLGEAIRTLEQFGAARRGETPSRESKFQERISQAHLKLLLSAEGKYLDPYSYQGTGRVEVTGAELAQINLLGALSQALRGSSVLSFTSLKLTSAQSNFTIEKDRLVFPDLKIFGSNAEIALKGHYAVSTKQMDFNAKVYPFEQSKTLLANAVGFVLTPFSAVLELKLTGALDKPNWRFVYGPTSLLRTLTRTKDEPPLSEAPEEKKSAPPPLLRR